METCPFTFIFVLLLYAYVANTQEEDVMFSRSEQFVAHALSLGALELLPEGRALKSGRVSPYFFNSSLFTGSRAITALAHAYAGVIVPLEFDVLYGPPYKGTLLTPAVAMALFTEHKLEAEWASSRKEAKDHGEGEVMLGASLRGKNVLIVDDVITTGTTKNEALDLVREQGGNVAGVVIAFDRMETASGSELSASQLFTKMHHVPVHAASDLDDLIAVLSKETDFPNNPPGMLEKICAYKDMYGTA